MIIHLNGWPGAGKLTVGRAPARKLGARLVDNHTLHNVPLSVCDFGSNERWEMYYQIRDIVYARMRAMPKSEVYVMTNGLARETERDIEAWEAIKRLAHDRGDRLIAVTLAPTLEENLRRIPNQDRAHNRKLTDPNVVAEWYPEYTLITNDAPYWTVIDNTDLTPNEAADAILEFVRNLPAELPE